MRPEIHTLINSIWNKEELPEEWNEQRKLLGILNVDFEATGQLLIMYSVFVKYLRKNGNKRKQCSSHLLTSRKLMTQVGGGLV